MRRLQFWILASILMFFTACMQRERLQEGDLIFVGTPRDYSSERMGGAIAEATGAGGPVNYIHVGIVRVRDGVVSVVDATPERGVAVHSLHSFIEDALLPDGSLPVFTVRRLRDTSGAAGFVRNAERLAGLPYDETFLPENEAYYCSELVWAAYVREDGTPVFRSAPMNFLAPDGRLPRYWQELFDRLGMGVPQGVAGTNPQDMSDDPALKPVRIDIRSFYPSEK